MFESHFQTFTETADPTQGRARLGLLRGELRKRGLQGFIVPRSDEHQNEYVPPGAERLAWLTGFHSGARAGRREMLHARRHRADQSGEMARG
jgi:Xaa-Pro aminopeptidase